MVIGDIKFYKMVKNGETCFSAQKNWLKKWKNCDHFFLYPFLTASGCKYGFVPEEAQREIYMKAGCHWLPEEIFVQQSWWEDWTGSPN